MTAADRAVLLLPGMGGDRDHGALVAIEEALDPVPVERVNFPFQDAGKKRADPPPLLQQTVRDAAASLAERTGLDPGRLVLGGRSLGGRMCSMVVADGVPALGLALVSYPLHPIGKPDLLRTGHLPQLDLPCLFVSGTRDNFGAIDELEAALELIPGPVTKVWLDGGDHGLRRRDADVAAAVRDFVLSL